MDQAKLSAAIPQLPTGNIDKTASFFAEQLGFEVVGKYDLQKFLIMKRGQAEIHFWQTDSEDEAKELGSNNSCCIRVENIITLFEEFKSRGASFRYELTKQPWGMYEMQIDDPYLNAIRFGEIIN